MCDAEKARPARQAGTVIDLAARRARQAAWSHVLAPVWPRFIDHPAPHA